jgi:hypothetical protein
MSGSSDYTKTPNLGLFKPTFNADVSNWGQHWNQNADTLDSAIPAAGIPDAPSNGQTYGRLNAAWAQTLSLTGGTMTGPLNMTATHASTVRAEQDRWADVINVLDYGAGPAMTGAQNLAAFRAAAVQANRGPCTIYIPAGNYTVDDGEILFTGQQITLAGAGAMATWIKSNASTSNLFHFIAPSNGAYGTGHTIRDLYITCLGTPTAGALIKLDHIQMSAVDHVNVQGGFINLDMIACLSVRVSHSQLGGDNGTPGSTLVRMTRFKVTANTSADTPGGTVLPFASTAGIYAGQLVTGTNIAGGTRVASYTATSVTLNTAITGLVASGSALTFADHNNSECIIVDSNVRGTTSLYTNALVLTNCDGVMFIGVHFGFCIGPDVLFKPLYTDDVLQGVTAVGAFADQNSGGHGFNFQSSAGGTDTGSRGFHSFSGCSAYTKGDGYKFEDPGLKSVKITGSSGNYNAGYGINIQAGSDFAIGACNFDGNNGANVMVGGTASGVSIGSSTFRTTANPALVPYHIIVADAADYVSIGINSYASATSGDISVTSTGTHNAPAAQGATDQAVTSWIREVDTANARNTRNRNGANLVSFTTSVGAAASQYWSLFANGSPQGPTLLASDSAANPNVNATVQANGTGILNLGVAANTSIRALPPLHVGKAIVGANPLVGAVSEVMNAQFAAAGDQRVGIRYQLWNTTSGAAAVRLTTDGAVAGGSNVGNLTSDNRKMAITGLTVIATDLTTPANDYTYYVPISFLTRYAGGGSTVYRAGTPVTFTNGVAGASTSITADLINAAMNISWTPPAGNTDTWHITATWEGVMVQ